MFDPYFYTVDCSLGVQLRCFDYPQVRNFNRFPIKYRLLDVDHQMARSIYRLMSSLPTFETLKLSQPKPHVTLVELNRPTKLNAMNKELFEYNIHFNRLSIIFFFKVN